MDRRSFLQLLGVTAAAVTLPEIAPTALEQAVRISENMAMPKPSFPKTGYPESMVSDFYKVPMHYNCRCVMLQVLA